MYTTYHLASAQSVTTDFIDSIKATFKESPIVITVEEEMDETAFLLADAANKSMRPPSSKSMTSIAANSLIAASEAG